MSVERFEIFDLIKSIYPFRKLDPVLQELASAAFECEHFDEGQFIYTEGDLPEKIYICYNGRISLIKEKEGVLEEVARLRSGDFFGYEMLNEKEIRQTSARAAKSGSVLSIDRARLVSLAEQIPEINIALEMLYESFHLSLRIDLKWRNQDEAVYFISRRHTAFLFYRLILPFLFTVITVPILVAFLFRANDLITPFLLMGMDLFIITAWVVWSYFDWLNDYSIVTNQRVLFQEKIAMLYDSVQESPLSTILAVTTETSQFGRWVHYGDVKVRTYGGMIVLSGVENPGQVEEIVRSEWTRASSEQDVEERKNIERQLTQRLKGHRASSTHPDQVQKQPGQPADSKISTNAVKTVLNDMFQIRFSKDGVVTYWKHWIKLFEKSWWIVLLYIALAVFSFARLFDLINFLSPPASTVFVLILGFVLAPFLIYQYIDWRNDFYVITSDQILDVYRRPLGREERQAAPLKSIQSIEFTRTGLIGVLLNYGTVYIRVGETELTFDDVFNPSEVQRELFHYVAERERKEREKNVSSEKKRIADWLEVYHQVVDGQENPENPPEEENSPYPPYFQ